VLFLSSENDSSIRSLIDSMAWLSESMSPSKFAMDVEADDTSTNKFLSFLEPLRLSPTKLRMPAMLATPPTTSMAKQIENVKVHATSHVKRYQELPERHCSRDRGSLFLSNTPDSLSKLKQASSEPHVAERNNIQASRAREHNAVIRDKRQVDVESKRSC